jgi:tetratricopeptide (TPR) repeat protein
MKRKIVVIVVACVVFLGVGIHWANEYLTRRIARGLLAEARRLEAGGHLQEAASRLNRYLRLTPGDTDALALYGSLLGRLAHNRSERTTAFLVLEQVLRRDEQRKDLRRQTAEAALAIGRFKDAEYHLKELRKEPEGAEGAELLHLLGRCQAGDLRPEEAAESYKHAVASAPKRIDVWQEYAALLRERLQKPETANRAIEEMLRANPESPDALLTAVRYYHEAGEADRAAKLARDALDPPDRPKAENPELLWRAADLALDRDDLAAARRYLERGLARSPDDRRLGQELARVDLLAGHRAEARRHLESSLHPLPERPDELWRLGNLLVDAGDGEAARAVSQRLARAGAPAAADCLRARVLMLRENWAEARKTLEKVRFLRQLPPVLARLSNYLLAECYDRLASPDQQLAAYRRALESDPKWLPGRRGVASSLASLGKLDQAITEYRGLVADAPAARPVLVRLLVARNRLLKPGGRPWGEIERLLAEAEAAPKGRPDPDLPLLRAEVLVAQDRPDEGLALAMAECERDPTRLGPWFFRIGLTEQQGPPEAVPPLIDEAERGAGRRADWQLARARHWARRGGPEAHRRLRAVEASLPGYPEADQERLLAGLTAAFAAAGDLPAAERLWQRLADRRANDVRVRFALFEVALQRGEEARQGGRPEEVRRQDAQARRWLEELKRLEGDGGPLTAYGSAAYQVAQARRQKVPGRKVHVPDEARKRLAEAAAVRPSWSRVPLLEAEMEELEDEPEKARERYRVATALEAARSLAARALARFLPGPNQDADAYELPAESPDGAPAGGTAAYARLALLGREREAGSGPDRALWCELRLAGAVRADVDAPGDAAVPDSGETAAGGVRLGGDETVFSQARELTDRSPATSDWSVYARVLLVLCGVLWLATGLADRGRSGGR